MIFILHKCSINGLANLKLGWYLPTASHFYADYLSCCQWLIGHCEASAKVVCMVLSTFILLFSGLFGRYGV